MQDLLITQQRAPGDAVVLTGLVRDLALAHPGLFRVHVDTRGMEVWHNSPHAAPAGPRLLHGAADCRRYCAEDGDGIRRGIHASQREPVHYLAWHHRLFAERLGLAVPVAVPRPDVHLTEDERTRPFPGLPRRYWVIAAGGKADATVKIWPRGYWQELVHRLAERGIACVQVGRTRSSMPPAHIHFPLEGVYSTLDRAPIRELIRIIHHADGVVCGVTLMHHLAAALERPCVVLGGGREAAHWEAYARDNPGLPGAEHLKVSQRFLHTHGLLDCRPDLRGGGRPDGGCWKNWTTALDMRADGKDEPQKLCRYPEHAGPHSCPRCMAMITPQLVESSVLSYYEEGALPAVEPDPDWARTFRALCGERPPTRFVNEFQCWPPARPAFLPQPTPSTRVDKRAMPVPRHDPLGFDSPAVGGRLTLFTLLYGDHRDLHRRFLDALVPSLVPGRVELRVLSQELHPEAAGWVDELVACGVARKHYRFAENIGKWRRLREALRDPELPVETNYFAWLDDDSLVQDPDWLRALAHTIAQEHPNGARIFGPHYRYTMQPSQWDWADTRPWRRGRSRDLKVDFVMGSLFALNTAVARELDLPDPEIAHNGGDAFTSLAVTEAGWGIGRFSQNRKLVAFDSLGREGRRGLSEPHPGNPGWLPASERYGC